MTVTVAVTVTVTVMVMEGAGRGGRVSGPVMASVRHSPAAGGRCGRHNSAWVPQSSATRRTTAPYCHGFGRGVGW